MSSQRGRPPMSTAERLEAARRHQEQTLSERNRLLALLSTHYPAHLIPVADRRPEWRWALCIHLPSGVVAWRLSDDEIALEFAFLKRATENTCERHSLLDKYDRLGVLTMHRVDAGHTLAPQDT